MVVRVCELLLLIEAEVCVCVCVLCVVCVQLAKGCFAVALTVCKETHVNFVM